MNKLKRAISLILVSIILCLTFAGCAKETTDNPIINQELGKEEYVQTEYSDVINKIQKNETVYVNTDSTGKIYNVNVTDWIHTETPQVRVEDYSDLKDIKNVNTLTKPVNKNDRIYWDMDTTDLYYSGKTEKVPPISFKIKYFMDGKEVAPINIVGQKGNVSIKITLKNSLKRNVKINNKNYEIYCPFFVAGGTIFENESFSNVKIDHGTTISDGSKQIVFFTGIPGMEESLNLNSLNLSILDKEAFTTTFTISAYTESFKLGNIMFAVTPLSSLDIVAEKALSNDIDGAKDVLSDIEKLQSAMNSLDVKKVINLLYGDVNKVQNIMNTVNEAAKLYKENEKMLNVMGKYMTDENMVKLDKLVTDLKNTDLEAIKETLDDPKLKLLIMLLPDLSEKLSNVSVLSDDINAVMPIFNNMAKDLEEPEVKKSIENLPQTIDKLNGMVKTFEENKELLKTFADLTSDESKKKIESITEIANKYADLESLSPEEAGVLADKVKAWLQFGSEYTIFTRRTVTTKSTVIFTYKTDAIK